MCGIVGVVSNNISHNVIDKTLNGLASLEYRGYDSAGIATISNNSLQSSRAVGKLENLRQKLKENPLEDTNISIGHTRWATHGVPSVENTHPHFSKDNKVSLVHNGIIENAKELRNELSFNPSSKTDTAVVAQMLAETGLEPLKAIQNVVQKLKGSYAFSIIFLEDPNTIYGVRHNSPLVIGKGINKDKNLEENYLASDTIAFIDYTDQAIEIKQDQIVVLKSNDIKIYDYELNEIDKEKQQYKVDKTLDTKLQGYKTFMQKEIFDTPIAVKETILGTLDNNNHLQLDKLDFDEKFFKELDKIIVLACGTAAHSGYVARYAIEHWTRIDVEVEFAHEFRYRDPILTPKTLIVAISQSGETMDTLMALRYAKEQGSKTLAICNSKDSSLSREADSVLYTNAGREISVASTKAFTCQIVACYLLGLYFARVRGNLSIEEVKSKVDELLLIPSKIENILMDFENIYTYTQTFKNIEAVLFLGRHTGFPIALEGALKLKEIAYIHAEGFAAGELKHGPIAIISEGQLVIVVIPPVNAKAGLHAKVISNIQEILSRGAKIIAICEEGDIEAESLAIHTFTRPQTSTLFTPMLDIVPLQIFALALTEAKGLNVDMPRNLAKSVTVE